MTMESVALNQTLMEIDISGGSVKFSDSRRGGVASKHEVPRDVIQLR